MPLVKLTEQIISWDFSSDLDGSSSQTLFMVITHCLWGVSTPGILWNLSFLSFLFVQPTPLHILIIPTRFYFPFVLPAIRHNLLTTYSNVGWMMSLLALQPELGGREPGHVMSCVNGCIIGFPECFYSQLSLHFMWKLCNPIFQRLILPPFEKCCNVIVWKTKWHVISALFQHLCDTDN